MALIRSDNDRGRSAGAAGKSRAAAVIVHIISPRHHGGSEQLYDALVRLKAKKPLVVVVEDWRRRAATSTHRGRSYRCPAELAGRSIGVLFQFPNLPSC